MDADELYLLDESLGYLNEGIFPEKNKEKVKIYNKVVANLKTYFIRNGFTISAYATGIFGGAPFNFSHNKTNAFSIKCKAESPEGDKYAMMKAMANGVGDVNYYNYRDDDDSSHDKYYAGAGLAAAGASMYTGNKAYKAYEESALEAIALLVSREDEVLAALNNGIGGKYRVVLDNAIPYEKGSMNNGANFEINLYLIEK